MPTKHRSPDHLTPRRDGRFCKKFRGQWYILRGSDHEAALRDWLDRVKPAALNDAQPPPPPADPAAVTVGHVVNGYLSDCQGRVDAGRLSEGTFADYLVAATQFAASAGTTTRVADLKPEHFAAARRKWAGELGPWKIDSRVQSVRTMFKWAREVPRLLAAEPWYGREFGKTPAAEKRRVARAKDAERGTPIFSGSDVRDVLCNARPTLKAMVALALNGGMYARDVAWLRLHEFRREGGEWVVDLDRGKTGVPWTFVCWPETARWLREAIESRPTPRSREWADLAFITTHGRPFHRYTAKREGGKIVAAGEINAISQEFDRVLEAVGAKREGVGFGKLRHTYVTAVDDHPDRNAARRSRGHKVPGIEEHYRKITVDHLRSVAELARLRLLSHPGIF